MIPSNIWKYICGWGNYSGKVRSQKIGENLMGNRGSKSAISPSSFLFSLSFPSLSSAQKNNHYPFRKETFSTATSLQNNLGKFSLNINSKLSWLGQGVRISSSSLLSKVSNLSIIVRNYSTGDNKSVDPVKIYENTDLQKLDIINDNRGKSGIYRWINQINGKSYVGSSVNLTERFTKYLNFSFLANKGASNMSINKALLKYGYANFSLQILEYCEKDMVRSREQYYLDLLVPEYNILKTAGSLLGFKHTEETIEKLKAKFKDRVFTPEHLTKLSVAKLGNQNATGGKGRKRAEGAGSLSVQVEVFDQETGIRNIYPSMREVSEALKVPSGSIRMYFSRNGDKPFKGRYIMKRIEGSKENFL